MSSTPNTLGIRREDLSKKGEKRVALVPEYVQGLVQRGHRVLVQPARHPQTGELKRAFSDQAYAAAGAEISEALTAAQLILGLKEVEIPHIQARTPHFIFSHTHKGQVKNRDMLRTFLERQCTLVDYELMVNAQKQRVLTAFTYFAGYAGMVDSLWALGKKWKVQGISNPLERVPQSIEREDLGAIKALVREVGTEIAKTGTPAVLPPLICCFLGTGKTSTGAQEIFNLLPVREISLNELPNVFAQGHRQQVYKLVLDVPDMYSFRPEHAAQVQGMAPDAMFQHYLQHPEQFESNLKQVFPYCCLWMNCIIWGPEFPRLLSREQAADWYARDQVLQLIGDITCDPEGAIQFSRETWIDDPVFTYQPASQAWDMGIAPGGISVMAVTNLPCEFSADASTQFSHDLSPFLEALAAADYEADSPEAAGLPPEVQPAVIAWRGKLTPAFAYMQAYLES